MEAIKAVVGRINLDALSATGPCFEETPVGFGKSVDVAPICFGLKPVPRCCFSRCCWWDTSIVFAFVTSYQTWRNGSVTHMLSRVVVPKFSGPSFKLVTIACFG